MVEQPSTTDTPGDGTRDEADELPTVRDAVDETTWRVSVADVSDTPRLDAELLVGHVTGLDRVELRTRDDRVLTAEEVDRLWVVTARRSTGEPVAYLLGSAWFYGHRFDVDRRVLVPRPETELLVELAVGHVRASLVEEPSRVDARVVVDACSGSGCVGVSVAAELGDRVRVVCTELSPDAADVARQNAARLAPTVEVRTGDLLEPVRDLGPVAAVVANPPYVSGVDAEGLEPGVRDHEPHMALFAAEHDTVDGMYGRLARQAWDVLEPGGLLALEHGHDQRELVVGILREAGFDGVRGIDDLAGIARVVLGYR